MLAHVKTISLALVINLVAGGIFAFAQDIIGNSAASYRAATAPGYNVTGLVFDLSATNPTAVAAITFQVAPSFGSAQATQVEIQTRKDGAWTECALIDDGLPARMATCTFDSLSADDVTDLNIVVK